MLLPNKLFSYNESILPKLPIVLKRISNRPYGVHELYKEVRAEMNGIDEYIEVLGCLYALGKVELDKEQEVLTYVV